MTTMTFPSKINQLAIALIVAWTGTSYGITASAGNAKASTTANPTCTNMTSLVETPYIPSYPGLARFVDGTIVHKPEGEIRLCFRMFVQHPYDQVQEWYANALNENGWKLEKTRDPSNIAAIRGSRTCTIFVRRTSLKQFLAEVMMFHTMRR